MAEAPTTTHHDWNKKPKKATLKAAHADFLSHLDHDLVKPFYNEGYHSNHFYDVSPTLPNWNCTIDEYVCNKLRIDINFHHEVEYFMMVEGVDWFDQEGAAERVHYFTQMLVVYDSNQPELEESLQQDDRDLLVSWKSHGMPKSWLQLLSDFWSFVRNILRYKTEEDGMKLVLQDDYHNTWHDAGNSHHWNLEMARTCAGMCRAIYSNKGKFTNRYSSFADSTLELGESTPAGGILWYDIQPGVRYSTGTCRLAVILEWSKKRIFLVYKGTDSIFDTKTDLTASMVQFQQEEMEGRMYVHSGFESYWKLLKAGTEEGLIACIEKAYHEELLSEIIVTGHSLGGAVAVFGALHAIHLLQERHMEIPVFLYTFGCPAVGNYAFNTYLTSQIRNFPHLQHGMDAEPNDGVGANVVNGEMYMFQNDGDPIPSAPLWKSDMNRMINKVSQKVSRFVVGTRLSILQQTAYQKFDGIVFPKSYTDQTWGDQLNQLPLWYHKMARYERCLNHAMYVEENTAHDSF